MSGGKGRGRPALGDVDLTDLPGPALPATSSAELERRRAFASSLESRDFVERSASAGMVKVVRPTAPPPDPEPPPPVPAPEPAAAPVPRKLRSEEPSFTVRLPDYLQQEVRMAAVRQKTTVRLILLRALRDAGFEVHEEDMTDDRGIVSKLRSRDRRPPS
jgi:hypothetical protein